MRAFTLPRLTAQQIRREQLATRVAAMLWLITDARICVATIVAYAEQRTDPEAYLQWMYAMAWYGDDSFVRDLGPVAPQKEAA